MHNYLPNWCAELSKNFKSPPLSKRIKGGGISLWLIKANSMQSYHSKSGPYSSVHWYCLHTQDAILISACMCQNKSSNNCDHWKKTCFKNVQKLGLNPLLRWLTTVCLRGFDRNAQHLFTVFSLHQCLQRAVMNERKQLSISNQHIRVPRWRAFNFAQVPFWCVLGMPSNSVIKSEF